MSATNWSHDWSCASVTWAWNAAQQSQIQPVEVSYV